MIERRPEGFWHAATLALVAGLLIGLGSQARAQHTPDPYNIVGEYNNQYEPYMYATYPNVSGIQPNQNRLEERSGVRRANSFQSEMESDSPDETGETSRLTTPRQSGPGVPYYRAYRRLDEKLNRTYRPNGDVDDIFFSNQQQRDKKFFTALSERDPRKRAQMIRESTMDSMRTSRDHSATGARGNNNNNNAERDRFSTEGSALGSDDRDGDEMPRPTSLAPAPRRPSSLSAPLPSTGRGLPPSAPTASRSGLRSPTTTKPARSSLGMTPSTSDVLKRSELMDRARSGTSTAFPSTPR